MRVISIDMTRDEFNHTHSVMAFKEPYGVPRKLKCAGCQVGDHCKGEDDGCYCECTETRPSV